MTIPSIALPSLNYAPSSYVARGIENLIIMAKKGETSTCIKYGILSRVTALTLFPLVLTVELTGRVVALSSFLFTGTKEEWHQSIELIEKCALGILCSTLTFPLVLLAPDAVSFLFLEREVSNEHVCPFGVERIHGKKLEKAIHFPTSTGKIQKIIADAKEQGKKISIRGAGMSQGPQTVPSEKNGLVLDLKNLNKINFKSDNLVKVGAGTLWEELQTQANKRGKSIIVKQASNLFSVGGSIGINCHGWEHDYGAIASTVEELEVIDASGRLRQLSMTSKNEEDKELFRCMFGTLGYFGVIVSATLRLTDNEELVEDAIPVSRNEFASYYNKNIKGNPNAKILMGRLTLDSTDGLPLRDIYVNVFKKKTNSKRSKEDLALEFTREAARGKRIERIFLNAVGHLPSSTAKHLLSWYWGEEKKIMSTGKVITRNEAMNVGMRSFFQLHQSDLYAQWLQEYFISEQNLPRFLDYLGAQLKAHDVRLLNASIRPVPKDEISILPYAEKNRYAVVLSFSQQKSQKAIDNTKSWIRNVQECLLDIGDKWYQAYMPYATQEEFERCYGIETVNHMRELKKKYDPDNLFSNGHTAKYFDKNVNFNEGHVEV